MSGRYKSFNYEITNDPEFLNKKSGITSELFRQMEDLHRRALKGGNKNIEKLILLIEKYPNVPQLKNFLSVAYMNSGKTEKAREVNHRIIREHPDYLFGKLNLAFEYYNKQQYDKIPEVVGSLSDIQDMYPDRDTFHISEVTSFNKLAILYFCAIGNLEAAESRYEILMELAPDHPDTKEILPYLMHARWKSTQKRMEEEERTRIRVKTGTPDRTIQREIKPEFIHKEINWLYENDLTIDEEKLKIILSLPYDTLVTDLTHILKDIIYRYDHFRKIAHKSKKWQESRMSFPIHAIYLLGELKAKESLNDILETLRQGEDFLEFWYGDFLTDNLWEPILYVAENRLDILKDFVLSQNIWTYARSEVACCVGQIGLHQPKRKKEVIEWFREVFIHLAGASLDDGIIDSDFIGLAIWDALELRAKELLPVIKRLFDSGYVSKGICGDFNEVKRAMLKPGKEYHKRKLLNIFDRYHKITTTWYGYTGKDPSSGTADRPINWHETQGKPCTLNPPAGGLNQHSRPSGGLNTEQKPGRNDPCPCGSGKKYKKCCLKKET